LKKPVKRVFTSVLWNKYVKHIFIDEAHCVLQWGDDKFRPKYRELYTLHSIFTEALFVAVTAMVTLCNQQEICRLLGMDNVCVISTSGNHENIKYVCLHRPSHSGGGNTAESSYRSCFLHLAEDIADIQRVVHIVAHPRT
jgi:superfamily II DNA helicase RecQ